MAIKLRKKVIDILQNKTTNICYFIINEPIYFDGYIQRKLTDIINSHKVDDRHNCLIDVVKHELDIDNNNVIWFVLVLT
jgi:hypothetical protein